MLANGDDPTRSMDARSTARSRKIQKAVDSGQVRQFTGNDYSGLIAKGDVWAAFAWSGDMVQLQADNPGLSWTIPKSGGMIWTDNMLIPKGGDVVPGVGLHELRLRPEDRGGVEATSTTSARCRARQGAC